MRERVGAEMAEAMDTGVRVNVALVQAPGWRCPSGFGPRKGREVLTTRRRAARRMRVTTRALQCERRVMRAVWRCEGEMPPAELEGVPPGCVA